MSGRAGIVERLREARPARHDGRRRRPGGRRTALAAGGLRCVEITLRTEAAVEALARVSALDGVLAGAGTVLTAKQAESASNAGAAFAVAPGLNETVVSACADLELPFFPGVATPSEIERARTLGLDVLKVFPAAQLGGPGFLRAVTPTYPDVGFLPTGGGPTRRSSTTSPCRPSSPAAGAGW